jgi:pimeloyl-ACP methyl ester carboxylesterase
MPKHVMPDVVVLLPGILGTALRKDGNDLWALSARAGLRLALGRATLDTLTVVDDDPTVDDLGDGVIADRLLDDIHLVPGLWKIDGYSGIRDWLMRTFELESGANYFEFAYDWRRDNRVAARRLARSTHNWLVRWRKTSGNDNAKLVLVAHSMGGLVSRYFLEVLDGWRDTRSLVTFGTPYRGSLKALNFIANGFRKSFGPFTIDLSTLLRSLPSVYQLLPTYACCDAGAGLKRLGDIPKLPNIDASKLKVATTFHDEIREAVDHHLKDDAAYVENRYGIFPIVGTHQHTLQSASLAAGSLNVSNTFPGQDVDGDGTVPRPSATPLEIQRDRRETFVATPHAALQNSDALRVQLEGILTGNELNMDVFRGFRPKYPVTLTVDDAFSTAEPIAASIATNPSVNSVRVHVVRSDSAEILTLNVTGGEGVFTAAGAPLREGNYRIDVLGANIQPTKDVFAVL